MVTRAECIKNVKAYSDAAEAAIHVNWDRGTANAAVYAQLATAWALAAQAVQS